MGGSEAVLILFFGFCNRKNMANQNTVATVLATYPDAGVNGLIEYSVANTFLVFAH